MIYQARRQMRWLSRTNRKYAFVGVLQVKEELWSKAIFVEWKPW
jgi:hypothetical protein